MPVAGAVASAGVVGSGTCPGAADVAAVPEPAVAVQVPAEGDSVERVHAATQMPHIAKRARLVGGRISFPSNGYFSGFAT